MKKCSILTLMVLMLAILLLLARQSLASVRATLQWSIPWRNDCRWTSLWRVSSDM